MMKKEQTEKGEIVIYKAAKGPELKVRLEKETVWLTQAQIAAVFGAQVPAITKHIKNIYKSGELSEYPTISKMEIVQKEGTRALPVPFWNILLPMGNILSVSTILYNL